MYDSRPASFGVEGSWASFDWLNTVPRRSGRLVIAFSESILTAARLAPNYIRCHGHEDVHMVFKPLSPSYSLPTRRTKVRRVIANHDLVSPMPTPKSHETVVLGWAIPSHPIRSIPTLPLLAILSVAGHDPFCIAILLVEFFLTFRCQTPGCL